MMWMNDDQTKGARQALPSQDLAVSTVIQLCGTAVIYIDNHNQY